MKLGVSYGSYLFTSGFVSDVGPSHKHATLGLPMRYYEPRPDRPLRWFIQKQAEYREKYFVRGISLSLPLPDFQDQAIVKETVDLLKKNELEVPLYKIELDYQASPHGYLSTEQEFSPCMNALRKQMEMAEHLNSKLLGIDLPGRVLNRYRKDITLEKQLERLSENLKHIFKLAKSFKIDGILLTNHAGYKSKDILNLVNRIRDDTLGVNFSVANPLLNLEDPIDAARELGPLIRMVTLNDLKVIGTTYYGCRILGVWLGKGSVDLPGLLFYLREKTAGTHGFGLIETTPLEGSEDRAVVESLKYMTENFHGYL